MSKLSFDVMSFLFIGVTNNKNTSVVRDDQRVVIDGVARMVRKSRTVNW